MSIWRLVLREIWYRKLGFGLSVFSVVVAVGCLVGQMQVLAQHDRRTEEILQAKEKETETVMARLQDDMRIITKNLGFNLRILPRDLNLMNFYARDYADKYMPEEYVEKLAQSKELVTINHLLPILQQKIDWPEEELTVILVGTRGEVPQASMAKKKPILDAVPPGKMVLGYQLHRTLSKTRGQEIKPGDKLVLRGRTFTLHKVQPSKGDQDDVTVWVHLEAAQEMLGKENQINGMLALGCNCSADRLATIRSSIAAILPDTQVEEWETKATARAEARNKVEAEAKAALVRERNHRAELRAEKEDFAAVLVPLVVLAAGISVAVLAFNNLRERRGEIGLLRALGLRSGQLFVLFLARACAVGLIGALAGMLAGAAWEGGALDTFQDPVFSALIVLATPLLCTLAAWLPALLAVRQDPALILQQE